MHVSGPPPARWASPSPVPVDPTCLEGLEVLQRLLLILQGVQRPHQQDDGEQAPWGEGGEEDGLSWILLCSHPLETLPALPKGPPPPRKGSPQGSGSSGNRASHLFSGSSSCSSLQDSSSDCSTVDFSTDSSHLRVGRVGEGMMPQPWGTSQPQYPV